MANPFVHVELNTQDPAAARRFYGALFDWSLEDVPMDGGTYTMVKVGNGTGGGMIKHPMPGAPSMWLAYVEVGDIQAATAKAKSLGAGVIVDVREVMGAGWLSIIQARPARCSASGSRRVEALDGGPCRPGRRWYHDATEHIALPYGKLLASRCVRRSRERRRRSK